jgi:hypothetical protein
MSSRSSAQTPSSSLNMVERLVAMVLLHHGTWFSKTWNLHATYIYLQCILHIHAAQMSLLATISDWERLLEYIYEYNSMTDLRHKRLLYMALLLPNIRQIRWKINADFLTFPQAAIFGTWLLGFNPFNARPTEGWARVAKQVKYDDTRVGTLGKWRVRLETDPVRSALGYESNSARMTHDKSMLNLGIIPRVRRMCTRVADV